MSERIGNLGYFGIIKEATKGTPLTPTDYVPLYDESMDTLGNFIDQQPIYGNKAKTFLTVPGQRSHKGDVTILAEPNTGGKLAAAFITKQSDAGSNPYTHVLAADPNTNPGSLTVDISLGNVVKRFWGVEISKFGPNWNKNELQFKLSMSALGSFRSRDIATVATTTLTLGDPKGLFNGAPNKGLVVGDLVRIYDPTTKNTLDTTIATVNVDGVTVTLGASAAAFSAGAQIYLRPATPSFTLLDSFLWAKTKICFGASASAALAATHTPCETGSTFELIHEFNSDDGEDRSGSFDPASLVRKASDASLKIKKYFDTPEDVSKFQSLSGQACVFRCFAGSSNQYEMRLTLYNIITDGKVTPQLKADDVEYSELDYHVDYSQGDGKAWDLTFINAVATV